MTIGYFADSANMSQNSAMASNLQSIVAQALSETAGHSLPSVSVVTRNLFNVTGSYTNTIMAGFLFFFPSIYLGITVLMLMGRLHVTGLWHETIMNRGISAIFNDLRFAGSIWTFLPVPFLTALAIGLCAMIFTFNATTPAGGAAFMIFIVPPGFVLGGVTVATALMLEWCQVFSHLFPLTWLFAFYRDIALRGVDLTAELTLYGAFIIYLTMLAAVVALKYLKAQKVLSEHEKLLAE